MEVHNANSNLLYGAWVDGKYFRTNGGVLPLLHRSPTALTFSRKQRFVFAIIRKHPQNNLTLLGATQQRLYKTADGGFLSVPVASTNGPKIFQFDQADPSFAYASAWSFNGTSSFWRSENGGDSWSTIASPGWRVTDIKASPAQAGWVYVSRNSNLPNVAHIYKSGHFSTTWTPVQGDPQTCL